MNTHDIELPPLPPLCIAPSVEPVDYPKVAQALMDYARTAVEADRQQRESIVTDDMRNAIRFAPFSAYWSDVLRDIFGPDAREGIDALERRLRDVEDDHQRRGSIVNNTSASSGPVAYMFADEWGRTKIVLGKETAEYWCPPDENITPLYTAPQPLSESDIPAEPNEWKQAVDDELTSIHYTADSFPSAKEAVKALIEWHVSVATDPVFQSVEPDSAKCAECGAELIPVRPGKWQHPDCSQSPWASEPVAWPIASPEDADKGWILDYRFLEQVEHIASQRTNYTTSMEATEQVLIATNEVLRASQPAEMVSKTDWSNELSSWSDEDFIRIFHERPDLANRLRKMLAEPVVADAPVPSDESTRKWKRIEEYSREVDGKKIDIYLGDFLLYCPELEDEENSGVVIGYYSESYRGWYTSDEKVFPTHFMPLPEKPL